MSERFAMALGAEILLRNRETSRSVSAVDILPSDISRSTGKNPIRVGRGANIYCNGPLVGFMTKYSFSEDGLLASVNEVLTVIRQHLPNDIYLSRTVSGVLSDVLPYGKYIQPDGENSAWSMSRIPPIPHQYRQFFSCNATIRLRQGYSRYKKVMGRSGAEFEIVRLLDTLLGGAISLLNSASPSFKRRRMYRQWAGAFIHLKPGIEYKTLPNSIIHSTNHLRLTYRIVADALRIVASNKDRKDVLPTVSDLSVVKMLNYQQSTSSNVDALARSTMVGILAQSVLSENTVDVFRNIYHNHLLDNKDSEEILI